MEIPPSQTKTKSIRDVLANNTKCKNIDTIPNLTFIAGEEGEKDSNDQIFLKSETFAVSLRK